MLDHFTLVAHLLLLGDDSEALRAVKGCIGDLGLEGEVLDLCDVEIFHLKKLRDGLESIFKCEDALRCNVSELLDQ